MKMVTAGVDLMNYSFLFPPGQNDGYFVNEEGQEHPEVDLDDIIYHEARQCYRVLDLLTNQHPAVKC